MDETIPTCGRRPVVARNALGCSSIEDLEPALLRLKASARFRDLAKLFDYGTPQPRRIEGRFGDDVVLESPPPEAWMVSGFYEKYPGRPLVIVSFSAPVYPSPETAVVRYSLRPEGGALVELERGASGWTITDRR